MKRTVKVLILLILPLAASGFFILHKPPLAPGREKSSSGETYASDTGHKDIVCLIYHRFGDSRYPSTNISSQLFSTQLRYLNDHNFNVITLGEAVDLMTGQKDVPDKTVVITVDDGFKSFLKNGVPLLKKYGYKATLFVNTETIGAGDYMDWKELSGLLKEGYEIGNHSDSHDYFLNHKDDKTGFFKTDLARSQQLWKDSLDIEPDLFAYPYGEYDDDLKEAVRSMGFKAAAAQNSGVYCENSDRFAIPRFPINDQYGNITMFIEKVNMKAIRLTDGRDISPLYDKNPPVLSITIPKDGYDLNHLQGFIQGGNPKLTIRTENEVHIRLVSDRKLSARRVLYTITVPSKDGKQWYWYSHVWINPGIKE